MSYKLYLDDIRIPENTFDYTGNKMYLTPDWVIVRSYNEFVKYVTEKGLPEIVSFDHDLADEHYHNDMYKGSKYNKHYNNFQEKTGFDCVKWMVDYCIDNGKNFPNWYLHTMNPAGKMNMECYIKNYLRHFGE
jgi:hypothetical protein